MKTRILKQLAFLTVCGTLFFFAGCKKDESVLLKQSKNNTFTPSAKVGDSTFYDAIGNFGKGMQRYPNSFLITTIEDMGGGYFKMLSNFTLFDIIDTLTILETENGTYEKLEDGTLKLIANDKHQKDDLIKTVTSLGDTIYSQVLDTDFDITVPAGNYKCIKVKEWSSSNPDYRIDYISQGLIKLEQIGSNSIVLELNHRNY